jgi:hypothetical protein
MYFLWTIPIALLFLVLVSCSSDEERYPDKIQCVSNFISSEEGYRLNVNYIKGMKIVETWPGNFVVKAYITGGYSYTVKSGFHSRESGNLWLDSFLKNDMNEMHEDKCHGNIN